MVEDKDEDPSTQPSCFPLGLEQGEDVALPDRSLDVPHDEPVLVVEKLDSDLGHLSSGSGASHHFHNQRVLHSRFHAEICEGGGGGWLWRLNRTRG